MTARTASPSPPHERALAGPVRSHLEHLGYRVWVDPDGSDYFDLVARRGRTVGLVELKIADGRTVLRQALRRRGWADWVAVAVPSERLARRIAARPVAAKGERIGVWAVVGPTVVEVRPAAPLLADGESDPFARLKPALHERLDLLESGVLPERVAWNLLAASVRALPGGRSTRDYRLEEFAGGAAAPDDGGAPRNGVKNPSKSAAIRP